MNHSFDLRKFSLVLVFVGLAGLVRLPAAEFEFKPADAYFAKFAPVKAPVSAGLSLKRGDRLAICGDSITEQRMYSRIIETYLTACVPDLKVTVRQYGWSGETAEGFLRRMTNDCLRFKPTIATTCYGMNDHRYKPYDAANAQWYRRNQQAIVRAFKSVGARVVLGSPGCVGKMPSWVKEATGTVEDLNLNLCALRNLGLELATAEKVAFADVFWPMFTAGYAGQQRYGTDYAIAGKDGVHPDWAGQLVMAYAFLRAMGLDGDLGTFTVNLADGRAKASSGHKVRSYKDGELQIVSERFPFCAGGDVNKDNSIRSAMTLVPFNEELNRLELVVTGGSAANYQVRWGAQTKIYPAAELARGVNLAADFITNPFSEAFTRMDKAVAEKQAYETRQIKTLFHGDEGRLNMPATAAFTERLRKPLAAAIGDALKPVAHSLWITPL